MSAKFEYRVVVTIPWTHQTTVRASSRDEAKRKAVNELRRSFPGWASRTGYFEQLDSATAYKEG